MQRRLSAIVAADVVGYSRMVGHDEDGTLAALRAVRRDVVDPTIAANNGRIVKLMGDGLLAEFSSVVDAVAAAVAVQSALPAWNAAGEGAQHIVFRIGVNLGDVVIDGEDIQGDGVNVAARLEALAEPGCVCVSDAVHDQVRARLNLDFVDLGAQELKNIARPVRVWQWSEHPEAATLLSRTTLSVTAPDLPVKPSIAVLPFDNMSADPEQEYFADGLAEDIITDLSRNTELFVIARNSSFTYRGKSLDLRQVGKELGVRFVLEGSVRRAGSSMRITAQLIEVENGSHIWAERFDRPVTDVFAVQDEITWNVASAVGSEIRRSDIIRAGGKSTESLKSWERLMKAHWHFNKLTAEDNRKGQDICRAEIEATGGNTAVFAASCVGFMFELLYSFASRPPQDVINDGLHAGYAGLERDPQDEMVLFGLSIILRMAGEFDEAISVAEAAIAQNPNSLMPNLALGNCLAYFDPEQSARAITHLETGIRLGPRDVTLHWSYCNIAAAHFINEDYPAAVANARASIRSNPANASAHRLLVASLALMGQMDAAKTAWLRVWELQPFDPPTYVATMRRAFRRAEDVDRLIEGLGLAGAPFD